MRPGNVTGWQRICKLYSFRKSPLCFASTAQCVFNVAPQFKASLRPTPASLLGLVLGDLKVCCKIVGLKVGEAECCSSTNVVVAEDEGKVGVAYSLRRCRSAKSLAQDSAYCPGDRGRSKPLVQVLRQQLDVAPWVRSCARQIIPLRSAQGHGFQRGEVHRAKWEQRDRSEAHQSKKAAPTGCGVD